MGWLLSLGLCIAGLAAIIVEFFVPAAGLIGVLGLGSIVGGIVLAYIRYGTGVGAAFLIGTVVITPAVIALYFKLFPRSFVGRWLILRGEERPEESLYTELAGKTGSALTSLRPSGTALIGGIKHSVVTAGEYIERGEQIMVSKVEGNRIVVRKGV